ncbi:MAG TPA: helix-turn-helix domain-containing protein [Sandaracinaceae bacterium]
MARSLLGVERATRTVSELIGGDARGGAPSARPVSADMTSDDPDHLAELMRPWPRIFVQTERGAFHAELSFTWLGPVSLLWERAGPGLAAAGAPLAGTRSLAVVTAGQAFPTFCGRPVLRGDVAVTHPEQEWHGRWPQGLAFVNTVVDVDALAACAERIRMPDPSLHLREISVLAAPVLAAQLVQLHARALRDRAELVAPGARRMLATEIQVRIIEGIARAADASYHLPPSPVRGRAVARALAFMQEAPPEGPTVPDLCDAARVSARTLEYAFREFFGVTPVRFLKLRRLNAARTALLHAANGETVSGVALRFGFGDFGHFAQDYRALFGEAPSETLRGDRALARARSGETRVSAACGADSP